MRNIAYLSIEGNPELLLLFKASLDFGPRIEQAPFDSCPSLQRHICQFQILFAAGKHVAHEGVDVMYSTRDSSSLRPPLQMVVQLIFGSLCVLLQWGPCSIAHTWPHHITTMRCQSPVPGKVFPKCLVLVSMSLLWGLLEA